MAWLLANPKLRGRTALRGRTWTVRREVPDCARSTSLDPHRLLARSSVCHDGRLHTASRCSLAIPTAVRHGTSVKKCYRPKTEVTMCEVFLRRTDKGGMTHKTLPAEVAGEPPVVVLMERRHAPDWRALWRGGRRDRDWQDRPDGAWSRVAGRTALLREWRRLLKAR